MTTRQASDFPIDLAVPVSADDHVTGVRLDAARHVLVEYGDYECSSCHASQPAVERLLEDFGHEEGGLAFVFRHFPLTSLHPKAGVAAQAAEAAAAQGKFWEMHRHLYREPGGDATDHLERLALRVGLEPYQFQNALTHAIHADRVERDAEAGRQSGVRAAPTFFLNGTRLDGPPDEVLAIVRRVLTER